MAVYKGREVQLLGKTNGEDTAPLYTIQHRDGNREDVKLNQIQLTEDEVKVAEKSSTQHLMTAPRIKNEDLQKLRDSQDRTKIEKQQGTQKTEPVEVSKVLVDPTEVTSKTTVKK
jgi:hypothetical protein